ncbi:hypothetical protein [Streptomyces hokutonensis]
MLQPLASRPPYGARPAAGSTGACNPSTTIAALAEHSMRTIVQQDLGRVF